MARDPDAFRAFAAMKGCLSLHSEIFADESFVTHILEIARDSDPPPFPGPDRDQLIALLDAAPATV